MGTRQRSYWLKQVDALRRQAIADIAHGVGVGMASPDDRRDALDALELAQTKEESKKQLSKSFWSLTKVSKRLAKLRKGGKGV